MLEWHVKDLLGPAWAYPARRVPRAIVAEASRIQLDRSWLALRTTPAARGRSTSNSRRWRISELKLRVEDVHWREVDGEVIALEARGSTYVAANGAGTLLWRALVAVTTREALVNELIAAYGIDRERAAADAEHFLRQLDDQGLIDWTTD